MKPGEPEAHVASEQSGQENSQLDATAEEGRDKAIESAMSFGMRAGSQFLAAVVVGGGLGWLIDSWLGTKPICMLVLMVLLFVAAMVNVWRMMSKAVDVATAIAMEQVQPASTANSVRDGMTEEFDGKSS